MALHLTTREWLDLIASNVAARLPRGRTHFSSFAPALARDVPRHWLTAATAAAVEPHLLALPTYPELLAAVRREADGMPRDPDTIPHGPISRPAETLEDREAREDAEDRAWWEDRVARVRALANPTVRWREAMGMLAVLERPKAHPRPWLVRALTDLAEEAMHAGAEIDSDAIPLPPRRAPSLALPAMHRGSRSTDALPPAAQPDYAPSPRHDETFTAILAKQARDGDEWARERLERRLGLRIRATS